MLALLMCVCLVWQHVNASTYLPPSEAAAIEPPTRITEYFSYNAPAEDTTEPWQAARQLAQALSPTQQVVFIRTPETNLFTLTAKQLAAHKELDIYVLQRQIDAASLVQQQAAIEQQPTQKPSVHFVKYRTPADVTLALSKLRSQYDKLPGSSSTYAIETANAIELKDKPQPSKQESIIFKIRPHGSDNYETHEQASDVEMAKLAALFHQYLPAARKR